MFVCLTFFFSSRGRQGERPTYEVKRACKWERELVIGGRELVTGLRCSYVGRCSFLLVEGKENLQHTRSRELVSGGRGFVSGLRCSDVGRSSFLLVEGKENLQHTWSRELVSGTEYIHIIKPSQVKSSQVKSS
jgi:hypothetical protein